MDSSTPLKKKIAIYGSRRQEGHIGQLGKFIDALTGLGIEVYIEKKLAKVLTEEGFRLQIHGAKPCVDLPEKIDVVVSAGGDGTFLRAARWIGDREVPILGINTGHLGFLANCPIEHVERLAGHLAAGEGTIEKRFILEVEVEGYPSGTLPFALNEVAFLKGETSSMIDAHVTIDGSFLADYRADGLIVATPTGSTAYNLSVGGPIIDPTLECMVLSPIAPHTLTLRPLVAAGNAVIKASIYSRASEFRLSIDGRSFAMPCEREITVRKADYSVRVLRMPEEHFTSTLRNKLLWGHSQTPFQ